MNAANQDFLVEIHTEELPPKSLVKLAEAFWLLTKERLQKTGLAFEDMIYFATPRRLALLIKNLAREEASQVVERKGPALSAAYDAKGNPTPACLGFAKSCGIQPDQLQRIKTDQGEWVGYSQPVAGKSVAELLPGIIEQAALSLPVPKRMRWGDSETQFVRPVHAILMLYGDEIVPATLLGCKTGRITQGHRFMAPDWMTIPTASAYASLLETEGYVLANFAKRREKIRQGASVLVQEKIGKEAAIYISSEDFLNEVTGLVEWPVAIMGNMDASFLSLPKEVLMSAMQDHQRYFPVMNAKQELLPHFVTISNIETHDKSRIIEGNERVLRARLADAAFFYAADKQIKLADRVDLLKGILFQAKLGTLYDKAERLSKLSAYLANKMELSNEFTLLAGVAGVLAKADLTTQMVGEFPELQGIMGYYYALQDGEREELALAMKEQYLPRYAGDDLPSQPVSQALALADRIDMLVGSFGIGHLPTGDKDPYGLRRAALGLVRILIEKQINLDLQQTLTFALANYQDKISAPETVPQIIAFIQERLRAWYQDQGIAPDVFAAVAALGVVNPLDVNARIQAVQAFKQLPAAEALSAANKRVSNILAKSAEVTATHIDPTFFDSPAELALANQLEDKTQVVQGLYEAKQYDQVLMTLATLREPIDNFFDQVMVMTDNKIQRDNRILLLKKLRAMFLQVADIALLQ